jgi:glycosyltransferase involved in cell wall biosynthesis
MRIAFLSTMSRLPWGGSEELWRAAAAEALAAGHEVLASAYRWPDLPAPLARLRDAGARIDLRPRSRRYRRSAILTWIRDPFAAVARFDPDVVCVSQGGTFDIGRRGEMATLWRGCAARGWPYVILCQCEQDPPAPAIRKRCARVVAGAAAVGFLGARPQREAERQLGLPIPAGRTIQNPFTLGAPGILPWPDGPPLRLLFAGRLEPVKGVHLIVEALAGPAWRTRDWRLTIAGDGSQREALAALARSRGIADRVAFPGFIPDIGRAWRNHHALVLPSRAEGLPLVMIEAMLCGRPVVATPAGSVGEWVEDGSGGFLVARPDAPALAEALERLWTRRADLEAMGRAAYDHAARRRDPNPARTLLRWLEEIAKVSPS